MAPPTVTALRYPPRVVLQLELPGDLQLGIRKELMVEVALHDHARGTRMLDGEGIAIARYDNLGAGIAAEQPGDEGNGTANRLQVAWRYGDDQAAIDAGFDLLQRMADRLDMPSPSTKRAPSPLMQNRRSRRGQR